MASGGLFRVGIFGWLIAIIGDVVRAWALYVFFRQVNKSIALLAAWWMLLHDAIFGVANVCLVVTSELLGGAGIFAGMAPDQLHPLMMLLLQLHHHGFNIGIFFFSFHILLLGYLVFKSGYVPRILGVLLLITSISYLVDSAGIILFSNYPVLISSILALPMIIGELVFIIWLVFKGGKSTTEV